MTPAPAGRVVFIGTGPAATDLVTVRGTRRLALRPQRHSPGGR